MSDARETEPAGAPDWPTCPRCGARLPGDIGYCPACRTWVGNVGLRPKVRVPWRYDMASFMILILVLAVGLGLSLRASTAGIGVPILLLGPPTLLRSSPIFVNRRRQAQVGRRPDPFSIVFESCLISGVLLLAGSVAFVAVCFPLGMATINLHGASPAFWMAWVGGGLAACAVLYFAGRRTFPPRD